MFGLIKFLVAVVRSGIELLNADKNALRNIPGPTKYLAMILLSCFWCLAFGIYAGELMFIGYNMLGHVALITMAFVTWAVFDHYKRIYTPRRGPDWLRSPDRSSRCDEMTEQERQRAIMRLNRNVWNEAELSQQDQYRK